MEKSSKYLPEEWRDVPGYEGLYRVSNHGRVLSCERNRLRKLVPDKNGYLRVGIKRDGRTVITSAHRLVALAFLENPTGKKCVNHIDGVKNNNHVSNLEWATFSENWKHAIRKGLSNPRTRSKLDGRARYRIRKLHAKGLTHEQIAARYNVGEQCIKRFIRGETYRFSTGRRPKLVPNLCQVVDTGLVSTLTSPTLSEVTPFLIGEEVQ